MSDAFKAVIIAFLMIGLVVGVFFTSVLASILFNFKSEIKTDKLIVPEIELIIKDNKVDTLYIYKKP